MTLVPEKVELLKDIEGPLVTTGDTEAAILTLPAKPKMLLTVTEDAPEEPATRDREGLPATIVKSMVFTVTRKKWFREPLVAVTFTV
jgi:hypothetical protein